MKSFIKTVLLTSLLAGTLDILSAYISYYIKTGKISTGMFHYIAGGALGLKVSMKGGLAVALLGAFFHYFIAFVFTLVFFLLFPKLRLLSVNKYVSGLIYGLVVWTVMNLVVLPLSRLPAFPFSIKDALVNAAILMVLVGLPVSISAYNYYKKASV